MNNKHEDSKKNHSDDLCYSCINLNNCQFNKKNKISFYFCEEFSSDNYKKDNFINENKNDAVSAFDSIINNKNMQLFKGLCINCDNRYSCTIYKPESGIWHCEEYV